MQEVLTDYPGLVGDRIAEGDGADVAPVVVPVPVRRWPKPAQSSAKRTPARSAGTTRVRKM